MTNENNKEKEEGEHPNDKEGDEKEDKEKEENRSRKRAPVAKSAKMPKNKEGGSESDSSPAKKAVRFTEHEFFMTLRINVSAPSAEERLEQAKKAVDTTLSLMRGKDKKKVALLPLNDPKGTAIQALNPGHRITLGKKTVPAPLVDDYINTWMITSKSEYKQRSIDIHIRADVSPTKMYHRTCLKLLTKQIKLKPKSLKMSKRGNIIPTGAFMPSSKAIDSAEIELWFLENHGIYVGTIFGTKKDGIWKQCSLIDGQAVLLVAKDTEVLRVGKIAVKTWPYEGRHPQMNMYPGWTKMTFVPFNALRQIHRLFCFI